MPALRSLSDFLNRFRGSKGRMESRWSGDGLCSRDGCSSIRKKIHRPSFELASLKLGTNSVSDAAALPRCMRRMRTNSKLRRWRRLPALCSDIAIWMMSTSRNLIDCIRICRWIAAGLRSRYSELHRWSPMQRWQSRTLQRRRRNRRHPRLRRRQFHRQRCLKRVGVAGFGLCLEFHCVSELAQRSFCSCESPLSVFESRDLRRLPG